MADFRTEAVKMKSAFDQVCRTSLRSFVVDYCDSIAVDLYSHYSSYVFLNTDWLLFFLLLNIILFRLTGEVEELTESIESLKKKLLESEQSLRNLEDTRMNLEKEIAVKTNSIFIDRQKCMAHRTHYPVVLKLAGYQ